MRNYMTRYTWCQFTVLKRVLSGHYDTNTSFNSIPYHISLYLEAACKCITNFSMGILFIQLFQNTSAEGLQDNWSNSPLKDALNFQSLHWELNFYCGDRKEGKIECFRYLMSCTVVFLHTTGADITVHLAFRIAGKMHWSDMGLDIYLTVNFHCFAFDSQPHRALQKCVLNRIFPCIFWICPFIVANKATICDWICEKGSSTRIHFTYLDDL